MDEVKPAAWRYKALSAPDEPWQAAIRRPASGWPAEPLYTAEQIRAAVLAERERCCSSCIAHRGLAG